MRHACRVPHARADVRRQRRSALRSAAVDAACTCDLAAFSASSRSPASMASTRRMCSIQECGARWAALIRNTHCTWRYKEVAIEASHLLPLTAITRMCSSLFSSATLERSTRSVASRAASLVAQRLVLATDRVPCVASHELSPVFAATYRASWLLYTKDIAAGS